MPVAHHKLGGAACGSYSTICNNLVTEIYFLGVGGGRLKWLPESNIQVIELERMFLIDITTKHKKVGWTYAGLMNQQEKFLDSRGVLGCPDCIL